MKVLLSRYTERDIEQILTYTIETWGIRQFRDDQQLLDLAIKKLENLPNIVGIRDRDELFPGARSLPVGKHVIFFRVKGNEVEIVRILHEKMLPERNIPGDYL